MNYWLFKSEPDEYGIFHLASEPDCRTRWDGIRNYQARNYLRDQVRRGDRVLFYHSSCRHTGVSGTIEVVSDPYPDPSQFDSRSPYYDPRASREKPRWYCVDVKLLERFVDVIPTTVLKAHADTADLKIFSQGRLSVAPVTGEQWRAIQVLKPD